MAKLDDIEKAVGWGWGFIACFVDFGLTTSSEAKSNILYRCLFPVRLGFMR